MINDIKSQLKEIPKTSGVYQFLDGKEKVLYVGKAKNLLKRVTSYTKEKQLSSRISRMVFLAKKVIYTQTSSEVEALLLEHNLIKKLEPKFNILLRDDKTFPQILITNHRFPRVTKYRGLKNNQGTYFGPFASAHDVNRTIDVLRKSFKIRNCTDSEFKSRKKPCLEYQIKRCLAPCTNLITEADYESSVNDAISFLSGKSVEIQEKLTERMVEFSEEFEYEKAAIIRDQIKSLNSIQSKQTINLKDAKDFDSITLVTQNDQACIYVSFYRGGQNYGAKPYFHELIVDSCSLLEEFLGQFYIENQPPSLILLNIDLKEKKLIEEFLAKLSEKKVIILIPKRGEKLELIKAQEQIAKENLDRKVSQNLSNKELHLEIKNIFNLAKIPQRIEVYDNSHTGGKNAVGAMITGGVDGFIKSGYRKFNIKFEIDKQENDKNNISNYDKPSLENRSVLKPKFAPVNLSKRDDTAMMREVLYRRFSKIKKKDWPDLIILDGGKGQLNAAQEIFDELKIKIPFIAMSKGENRNAGEEDFHQIGRESFTLEKHSPVMYYLQRLRDEAHRFAIMTHRKRRSKSFIPD